MVTTSKAMLSLSVDLSMFKYISHGKEYTVEADTLGSWFTEIVNYKLETIGIGLYFP